MKGCILIVDDDENIRNLLSIYLENEGFKTIKVDNAKNAIEIIEEKNIELVLLDIMMPQIDGIEACIKIRQNKKMPIIMISAKSEDMDKIHGLTAGADDYITKPFNPLELIARVKAQLRRYTAYNVESNNSKVIIEIGDLTINTDTRQVWVGEKDVRLTPKEFDILELLARNKGIVLSIRKIYEEVWKEEFFKADNTVTVHITNLREKIEVDPKAPIYIKTIWGVGYKI
ncbi:response regulator transcription factor [Clostridium paraputrificum]|jgi:two-component system response regulator VanR|nr:MULTISPECIES: response regulator transcription factor [Clostridium]MDU1092167.1 response regulator transcription factor [Leclercia adecarboxylata]MDB2089482.1 response regulator transcription factor [Clostridium paraputrificum]MDB2096418.1 response regulator transcription factor [Clostridium paraputrificum]MDB2111618.1 response regulator transcription factor [Clostridium paraputrificum]MDB2123380.1 response regulator transcription factor [Clostridium paraputrificum]